MRLCFSGNTTNVMQVSGSPAALTTNQNTPVTFATNIATSLADTYSVTAQAPAGWTVVDRRQRQRHGHAGRGRAGRNLSDSNHRAIDARIRT